MWHTEANINTNFVCLHDKKEASKIVMTKRKYLIKYFLLSVNTNYDL